MGRRRRPPRRRRGRHEDPGHRAVYPGAGLQGPAGPRSYPGQVGGRGAGHPPVHADGRRAAHREGVAVGDRERGAQSPGARPGRPACGPGHGRRGSLGQARLAAGHGPRLLHQASHQPSHHRAERRDDALGPVSAEVAMGQKTHPIGFRLGATRTWSSRWFATKGYAGLLHEDVKIRRFIKSSLYHAGISRIDIERWAHRARITIFTARPGIIIGRKGAEVEKLKNEIQSRTAKEVYLNIEEVVHPELDAQLVAENVALQLQKRVAFRRAMKKAVTSALRLGADGI